MDNLKSYSVEYRLPSSNVTYYLNVFATDIADAKTKTISQYSDAVIVSVNLIDSSNE